MMRTPLTPDTRLPVIKIRAVNSAAGSKGSIHDDEKARKMGFKAGLVPGTTVLSYMSRLMSDAFGRQWQVDSRFAGRLRRPVYEGAEVTVEGTVVEPPSSGNGGCVKVDLRVLDSEGQIVAFASASCQVTDDA